MIDPLDIPPMLDRRPFVGTYTNLNSYDNCGHAFFRRYIKKDQPYVETPEMKWGNDVHSAFEYRVRGQKPLPQKMQQWEPFAVPFDGQQAWVEQKLGITADGTPCDFWATNVWFRGKADLISSTATRRFSMIGKLDRLDSRIRSSWKRAPCWSGRIIQRLRMCSALIRGSRKIASVNYIICPT